jgi:hypothetical protein
VFVLLSFGNGIRVLFELVLWSSEDFLVIALCILTLGVVVCSGLCWVSAELLTTCDQSARGQEIDDRLAIRTIAEKYFPFN